VLGLIIVIALAVGAAWLIGGSESSPREKKDSKARKVGATHRSELKPILNFRKNFCISAVSSRGQAPSAINFLVRCRTAGSREVGSFSIVHYTADGESVADIRAVAQHPVVEQEGSPDKHGVCDLFSAEQIVCQVPVRGPVVIRGSFRVDPQHRCQLKVGIRVNRPPKCGNETCELALDWKFLALKRPAGC
jgi:hypothetical protein